MSSAGDAALPFDDGPGRREGRPGGVRDARPLSVREVGESIQDLLAAGFPQPFWLVGEALQLERTFRRAGVQGHWYFDLLDEQGSGNDRPSLAVKMWKSTVQQLFGRGGRLAQRIEPVDGVVLKVLVRPDFYLPRGQLSFTILDIDPAFTEGNLERARRELLERLTAEGALERNGRLELPDVPLRIGLVTSKGSAAHHDVMQTLAGSGLGFSVVLCDARTQGVATGPMVSAGLRAVVRAGVDCVLLVRGGGSRHDLSGFDREDVARAVCACPVPVLTGIGHEIDTSVADVAAHTAFKTPTAAAEFLVQRVRDGAAVVEDAWRAIRDCGELLLDDGARRLGDQALLLRHAADAALETSSAALAERRHALAIGASNVLGEAREHLVEARSRLLRGPFAERLQRHGERLGGAARDLARQETRLARLDGELRDAGRRLGVHAGRRLQRAEAALDAIEQRARLLDPTRVLARGYAWLQRGDGTILMDAAAARVGEPLTAVLRDGKLSVRAEGRVADEGSAS